MHLNVNNHLIVSIFASVIDHFGDAGIALRLARHLSKYHAVCIYIDDVSCIQNMHTLDQHPAHHHPIQFLELKPELHYDGAFAVIELLCGALPQAYQQTMPEHLPWVQYQHLATEPWAIDCHMQGAYIGAHYRHMYLPGFMPGLGGVLGMLDDAGADDVSPFNTTSIKHNQDILSMYLFAYPHAATHQVWQALADACARLAKQNIIVKCYTMAYLYQDIQTSNLSKYTQALPWQTQSAFDASLKYFDVLWVRGEDSFSQANYVNAVHLWQAYVQDDDAHHDKVYAYLHQYTQHAPMLTVWQNIYDQINQMAPPCAQAWYDFFMHLAQCKKDKKIWQNYMASLPNVAQELLKIVIKIAGKDKIVDN